MEFTARELIDENIVEPGTYDIPLKNGRKIVVKSVCDFEEVVALRKSAADILQMSEAGTALKSWEAYLPISPKVADMIADFTALIVAPKFSSLEVLELCRTNGMFAAYLHGKIRIAMESVVPAAEAKALEAAKNDSGPTG
jgi:hypothetical protein